MGWKAWTGWRDRQLGGQATWRSQNPGRRVIGNQGRGKERRSRGGGRTERPGKGSGESILSSGDVDDVTGEL